MRLCAVFHCWDDWWLLRHSVDNIRPLVDGIIIVGSSYSNYKEYSPIPEEWRNDELFIREPHFNIPLHSETDKRNYGLDLARRQGYTHYLNLDADEFYKPEEFLKAKERFTLERHLKGLVCPLVVYFSSPTLWVDDITLVPFIHEITPNLKHEFNRMYPFAWDRKQIRIDPSRSFNTNMGIDYTEKVTMFHYSWVRKDYAKKIRNSTARSNLEKSTIIHDLLTAKEGEMCNFYGKVLRTAPNYFNLPENGVLDKDLLPMASASSENKPR